MKQRLHYGWWIVVGNVLIAGTMVPLIMEVANKFLLSVTTDLSISRSAFTVASTVLHGLGIFLSPLVSRLLEKGNLKKIQCWNIFGFCLAFASYSFAQRAWQLYISAAFLGVFYLFSTMIPISITITNWFHKKRGIAMSISMAGIGIGGFVWSPIVTWLLQTYGWRASYRIIAMVVLMIALPVSAFLIRKSPLECGLTPYGADLPSAGAPALNKAGPPRVGMLCFALLLTGMLLNGIINSGALGQFPPAIEELHGASVQAAVISAYALLGVGAKLLHGWIVDRFGVVPSMCIGFGAFSLSFLCMLKSEYLGFVCAMALLYGIGGAMGTVIPPLLVADLVGPSRYAQVYGIANSIMQVGLSLGSLIVAGIYDVSGTYFAGWVIMAAASLAVPLLWVAAGKVKNQAQPQRLAL